MNKFIGFLVCLFSQAGLANQTLRCQFEAGGPSPGTATVVITDIAPGESRFEIEVMNFFFPQGIRGTYAAKLREDGETIDGFGQLGNLKSGFFMSAKPDITGTYKIHLYADGDHRIEFGFGAALACK